MSVEMWVVPVLLALLVAILCVLVFLLFWHQPRVELPAEWQDKLRALESLSQATQLAVAKNDGAMHGLAQQMQGFTQNMQSTLEASRQAGGNAVDQLRACMQAYADIVMQPFGMCLIRVGDEEVPEPSRTELRRMKSEIDHAFRRLVAQGVQEGSLAPCDPKMSAFMIAGALSWIGRWYQPGGDYTPEQVAQQCIATLCDGVLRRPEPLQARRSPRGWWACRRWCRPARWC